RRRSAEGGDDAQLADEVGDPPQRPREVQRQGVEPQVAADEVRADDEHQKQRADEFGLEEVGVGDSPDGRAVVAGLRDDLRREQPLEEGDDRLGLLFQEAPEGQERDEGQRRQPGDKEQQADDPVLELRPHPVPGHRQPPPAVPGEPALPVLIALVEDRHGYPRAAIACSLPLERRGPNNEPRPCAYFPTASRNTSSSELRCGRRWRICSPSSAAIRQSRSGVCPSGSCTRSVSSCDLASPPTARSRAKNGSASPLRRTSKARGCACFISWMLPWASNSPRPNTSTWSQTASTSGSRWLEKIRLIPLPCDRSRASSIISCRPAGSMPLVGSSRIKSFASWTTAAASLSRCFIPVEYDSTGR